MNENNSTPLVQPCVPFNQGMPPYKAIEEIRLAIEKNDSSLVSVDALRTIETSIRDLIELYLKTELSFHLAMYFTEEYEKYYETENKKSKEADIVRAENNKNLKV